MNANLNPVTSDAVRANLGDQPTSRRQRAAKLLAIGVAVALPLTACTSQHKQTSAEGTTAPSASSSTSTKSKGTGLPPGVTNATSVPTKVANVPSLRRNVVISSCAKTESGWAASGTANNPGSADKTYTITIFFATAGGTVIGTGHTDVAVPAGGTKQWKAEQSFHAAPETQCVLRGVA